MVFKVECASGFGGLLEHRLLGRLPPSQRLWFCKSGVGPGNLQFWQVHRWFCCSSGNYNFRTSDLGQCQVFELQGTGNSASLAGIFPQLFQCLEVGFRCVYPFLQHIHECPLHAGLWYSSEGLLWRKHTKIPSRSTDLGEPDFCLAGYWCLRTVSLFLFPAPVHLFCWLLESLNFVIMTLLWLIITKTSHSVLVLCQTQGSQVFSIHYLLNF